MGSDGHWAGEVDYLNFDLDIGQGSGRKYPMTARSPTGGEVHAEMRFPFVKGVLESKLKDIELVLYTSGGTRRRINSPEEQTVQDFGRALFDALISSEVRSCYDVALREAERQGKGLRLRLHIDSPQLASLPWEFLYDSRQGEYVCLSTQTPLVRYPDLPRPTERLPVTPPLRILGMVVNAQDLDPLDIDYEKQRVEEAVKDLRERGMVELTWLPGQTWRDLQRAMRQGPWHVFHFIGHGGYDPASDEGLIAFANDAGYMHRLRATDLARLLDDHKPLRLVLLNSCEGARGSERDAFSSMAATLVRRGVPSVLAMQYEITDEAAIEFSRAFYEAVADGLPLDAAVAEARTAISIAIGNTMEWGAPVLYLRSPDGRIFDITGPPPAKPPLPSSEEPKVIEADAGTKDHDPPTPELPTPRLEPLPEVAAPAVELPRLDVLYAEAVSAYEGRSWDEAIQRFEQVQALDPNYADVGSGLAEARRQQDIAKLYSNAQHLHESRYWQGVLAVFKRIHELDKRFGDPDGLLASAGQALKASASAVRWWQRRRNVVLSGIGTLVSLVSVVGGLTLWNPTGNPPDSGTTTRTNGGQAAGPGALATATDLAQSSAATQTSGPSNLPQVADLPTSDGAMFGATLQHTGVYETSGQVPSGTLRWKFQVLPTI